MMLRLRTNADFPVFVLIRFNVLAESEHERLGVLGRSYDTGQHGNICLGRHDPAKIQDEFRLGGHNITDIRVNPFGGLFVNPDGKLLNLVFFIHLFSS